MEINKSDKSLPAAYDPSKLLDFRHIKHKYDMNLGSYLYMLDEESYQIS